MKNNLLKKIRKKWWFCIYNYLARYLPPTHKGVFGKFGGWLRLLCAQHLFKYCSSTANIEHMASFGYGEEIEIGDNSGIGIHCTVPNNIKIGDNVMMGPHCYFFSSYTHEYKNREIPMIKQGNKYLQGNTIIGDDVWIGRQCIVLACRHIGSHTIIGAGSVVSKDVPDYVVAAGNPIRVIHNR